MSNIDRENFLQGRIITKKFRNIEAEKVIANVVDGFDDGVSCSGEFLSRVKGIVLRAVIITANRKHEIRAQSREIGLDIVVEVGEVKGESLRLSVVIKVLREEGRDPLSDLSIR